MRFAARSPRLYPTFSVTESRSVRVFKELPCCSLAGRIAGRSYRTRSSPPRDGRPRRFLTVPIRTLAWRDLRLEWMAKKNTTRPAQQRTGGVVGSKGVRSGSKGSAQADQEGASGLVDLAGHVLVGDVVAGIFVGEVQHVEGDLRLGRKRRQRVARRQVELAAVFAEVLAIVEAALVVAERTLGRTLDPVVRQSHRGDVILPVRRGVPHHRRDA